MILDNWVTRHVQHITLLIILETLGTQRHTLIQRHVTADNRCLTDHHTSAVVDGEILTDLSPWVDVDTCLRVRLFRNDTRNHRHLQLMQFVGNTVMRHGVHTGITEDHLTIVGSSGIVIKHRLSSQNCSPWAICFVSSVTNSSICTPI